MRVEAASQTGVIVETVTENHAGHRAGIKPGDVIVSWRREASPPANPTEARGEIRSWSDIVDAEIEQAPRGPFWIRGLRDGVSFAVKMPQGPWEVRTRPARMPREVERLYEEGWKLVARGDTEQGVVAWRQAAAQAEKERRWELASWLLYHVGDVWSSEKKWSEAATAYLPSAILAEQHGLPLLAARAWYLRALALESQNALVEATESFERSLALSEAHAPGSLRVGIGMNALTRVWSTRGDIQKANEMAVRALAIMERWAPESDYAFCVLQWIGILASDRGEFDRAEAFYRRALALSGKLDKGGLEVAEISARLGTLALHRGDLVAAEELLTKAQPILERLAPERDDLAVTVHNLGVVAYYRGDLAATDKWLRRALELDEKLSPGSRSSAHTLHSIGAVAMARGNRDAAESYSRRSLLIEERLAPEGLGVAHCLVNLGVLAYERGDLALAEEQLRKALALAERQAPGGPEVALALGNLGELACIRRDYAAAERDLSESLSIVERLSAGSLRVAMTLVDIARLFKEKGEPATAEKYALRALPIAQRLAPGSALEAKCLFALGELRRSSGRLPEAEDLLRQAVAALEAQRGRADKSEEARAAYAAHHADIYRAHVEVLVELGRGDEAFHALERSRARSFLARLAERDIVFDREIPVELERERRAADAAYDRAQTQLAQADPKDEARIDGLLVQLRELRAKQDEVAERVRAASPRLAALKYPEPLHVSRVQQALDAGTVLLSYSVGPRKTLLFVVTATPQSQAALAVYTVPVERDALRSQVRSLRRLIEQPGAKDDAFRAEARRLFDQLIAPARKEIAASKRVVISPDDQLHELPFAVLYDKKRGYLVRWKPIHLVASATVYGELLKARSEAVASARSFLGFGDPSYRDDATTARFHLSPLPGARRELHEISSLFGDKAVVYTGDEASEERVKAIDGGVHYLHFACHGLIDDRFPLNSALALATPSKTEQGRDNGLLQAWEIIEQVRIRANLVVLSACETGTGQDVAGEGIVGLTRAFQFAGAQSVLASLWSVPDKATTVLMTRLYGYLEQGYSKDAAPRAAQIDLIDGRLPANQGPALRQPLSWASFQLVGDWR